MLLKRKITCVGLLFTSVGCMIGSGWLFGPFYAAKIAGPWSLLSWLLGGLMILCIALTFAELSSMIPITGGIARYSFFSHGKILSLVMSWLAWISCIAVAPTEVQALLQYLSTSYPSLMNAQTHALSTFGFINALLLLLIITCINLFGVKLLTRFNNLITIWKLFIPCFVVLTIMNTHFSHHNFTTVHFNAKTLHNIFSALPSGGIVFSFLGFREATSMAGESKSPDKALPFAVIGSVIICTLFYLILQVGFIGAIPTHFLQPSWSNLHFSGDSGPFLSLAKFFGLIPLTWLILADVISSPLGTAMIYTTTTSRLSYAMATNGFMPKILLKLNRFNIPWYAIALNFLVGIFLLLPLPTWQALIQFQSSAIILAYSVGPISLVALRKQQPHLTRPFKLAYSNFLCLLTFFICNLLTYWTGWHTIKILMELIFTASIIYFLINYKKNNAQELKQNAWLLFYFTWITGISYYGNFAGGLNKIPFGLDTLLIATFSFSTYKIALNKKLSKQLSISLLQKDPEFNNYLNHDSVRQLKIKNSLFKTIFKINKLT